MRFAAVAAVFVLALVGCGSGSGSNDETEPDWSAFGTEWCQATDEFYGGVEQLLAAMEAEDPGSVTPEVERQITDIYNQNC